MVKTPKNEIPPHAPTPIGHAEAGRDLAFEKGLPSNVDAERFVLGSVMLNDATYPQMVALLEADDFSMEKHRRIFARMHDLIERSEAINRVTLANELMKQGQLESVDGLSYLISLDQGLPELVNLDSYIRIVKEKSNLRKIIRDAQRRMDQAFMDMESKDIAAAGMESLQAIQRTQNDGKKKGQSAEDIAETFPGGIQAFLDPSQRPKGLPTGLRRLDEISLGFHPGELVILAARPSVGKSALMLNIAEHLCLHPKQRKAVSVFSLEMSNADNLTRILCSTSRVDSHKFRAGFLNAEERRRLQVGLYDLTQSRLKLYDDCIMMNDIESAIEEDVEKGGCVLAAVDYLGLIGVKKKGERRDLEVGDMTRRFKLLAKKLAIPILLLCQLSRAGDKRTGSAQKPILSDLRESGAIEADADAVWFIHREELYHRDRDDLKGLADLILGKNRHGPIGTVPLRFLGQFTQFCSRAEDLLDSEPAQPYNEA